VVLVIACIFVALGHPWIAVVIASAAVVHRWMAPEPEKLSLPKFRR